MAQVGCPGWGLGDLGLRGGELSSALSEMGQGEKSSVLGSIQELE